MSDTNLIEPSMDKQAPFGFLTKAIRALDKFNPIVRWVYIIGMAICFLWICYVFADVVLRYVFNRPITGSQDIMQVVLVFVMFTGVAYVQLTDRHITVDIITKILSPRAGLILDAIIYLISIFVVGILVWRGVVTTLYFIEKGSGTLIYEIPWAVPAAVIPICCFLFLLMLLRDYFSKLIEIAKLKLRGHVWLLVLGVPLLVMAILAMLMLGIIPGMSSVLTGIIAIIAGFVFIFLGMPIAISLLMVGFVFMGSICGYEVGLSITGTGLFWHVSDYTWTVVPFFILMGAFVMYFGLGSDAYKSAHRWLGHLSGGLGIATIGASTVLASVVGDPMSSTATIGGIALPEMKKYKYNMGLATGVVCSGATLGPMIPPSIPLIMYGILAEVSIGRLFIAGIIPGLLLALSFGLVVYIQCKRNPALGPAGEKSNWKERFLSLRGGGPILLIFLVVIGGIYSGAFSAIEGGGIGAFTVFILALIMRRITWKNFWTTLIQGGKLISNILFMVGCAMVFGHVLAASNLTTVLVDFVQGLPVPPLAVMGAFMVMFLVLGCVMDAPILIILTVPILAPVAQTLGFDLVWFGILLVLITNLGMITPPYAMIIFLLRGLYPEIPTGVMYRGILPFVFSSVVVALLILFFPAIATWLSNLLI